MTIRSKSCEWYVRFAADMQYNIYELQGRILLNFITEYMNWIEFYGLLMVLNDNNV